MSQLQNSQRPYPEAVLVWHFGGAVSPLRSALEQEVLEERPRHIFSWGVCCPPPQSVSHLCSLSLCFWPFSSVDNLKSFPSPEHSLSPTTTLQPPWPPPLSSPRGYRHSPAPPLRPRLPHSFFQPSSSCPFLSTHYPSAQKQIPDQVM